MQQRSVRRLVPRCRGIALVTAGVVVRTVMLAAVHTAPAAAAATIYVRGFATAQTGSGATSLTLTAPTGLAPGDLLVLDVDQAVNGSVTVPAGWTPMVSNLASYSLTTNIYYRVATSADVGASYLLSFSGSVQAVGRILDFVGTSATPYETDKTGTFCCFGQPSLPSITTTTADSLVVYAIGGYDSTGTDSLTTLPSGVTTLVNLGTSGTSSETMSYNGYLIQASAGATPSKSASYSGSHAGDVDTAAFAPAASGQLAFGQAPTLPGLPGVTLDGQVQTVTARMPGFGVDDTTGGGAGWNVTMQAATGGGLSPVFAQYCPVAACGTIGYVTGGAALAAGSLTLNSTGASWSTVGGSGTVPTMQCSSGCTLDSGAATKIASASAGGGEGPWLASGFAATSVSLAVPTTVRVLPASEVYRIDLVASLTSGP